MGALNFLLKLFRIKPGFSGTPEQYLAMVQFMAKKNNQDYSVQELMQWGEVMQKMMKVNLTPYASFADLIQHGVPDYTVVEKVSGKFDKIQGRIELKKAIYGEDVDLGDDDIMKSDEESAIFARRFVKGLSKHVDFSKEEQKKIDQIND